MLIHHLYDFFQGTLTIPKTRDLVHRPAARYEEMLSTIRERGIESNPPPEKAKREDMKGELAAFLQDLKKSNATPTPRAAPHHAIFGETSI
jgi:hypothetical protein